MNKKLKQNWAKNNIEGRITEPPKLDKLDICFIALLVVIAILLQCWFWTGWARRIKSARELPALPVESGLAELPVSEKSVKIYEGASNYRTNKILNDFLDIEQEFNLPPKLLLAQAWQESQWGKRIIAGTNNWFGVLHGKMKFESPQAGARYVANLITTDTRYEKFQRTGNICDMAEVYATDKNYCLSILRIINNL